MDKKGYKIGKSYISPQEFQEIDELSLRAIEKVKNLTKSSDFNFVGNKLEKYSLRFGGWEDNASNFKTLKAVQDYKKSLENFLRPEWEKEKLELYKNNLMSAIENAMVDKSKKGLIEEIKDITSVEEMDYIYTQAQGRLSISYFYIGAVDDKDKIYNSYEEMIKKYKHLYRKNFQKHNRQKTNRVKQV